MNNLTPWFYYMNGLPIVLLIIAMSVIVLIGDVVKRTEYQKAHFLCKYFGFSIETRCKLPRKPSI
jgi:hypothetical protein